MSEPKFTPGPWVYWRNNNNRIQIGASTNYSIAELWKTPMGETESNAHLIAAAPELYEALEWAYRTAVEHDDQEKFDWAIYCERLYQALAKARGEG